MSGYMYNNPIYEGKESPPPKITPQTQPPEKKDNTSLIYKPTETEKVFNWFSAIFYLIGLGLSSYSTYLVFKYFVGGATYIIPGLPPGTINPQVIQDLEVVSLLICSLLILMALFCFFGMVGSIRWALGKFGTGDHITLFVFNCFLFILSFVSALTYGLAFKAIDDIAGSSPGTEISVPFGTSVSIAVVSFIFIMVYIIWPKYLTK